MIQQLPLQHPSTTRLHRVIDNSAPLLGASLRARARKKKEARKKKKKKTSFHLSRGKNGLINIF